VKKLATVDTILSMRYGVLVMQGDRLQKAELTTGHCRGWLGRCNVCMECHSVSEVAVFSANRKKGA
jgi:hypothetical protein